jgi:hypothetical protein
MPRDIEEIRARAEQVRACAGDASVNETAQELLAALKVVDYALKLSDLRGERPLSETVDKAVAMEELIFKAHQDFDSALAAWKAGAP